LIALVLVVLLGGCVPAGTPVPTATPAIATPPVAATTPTEPPVAEAPAIVATPIIGPGDGERPASATPTASDRAALPPGTINKRGVHLLLDDGGTRWPEDVWPQHVALAAQLVGAGGHVVELIRLNDLDAASWQRFFDLAHEAELVPIVRLATWKDARNQWWEPPTTDADDRSYRAEAERIRRFFDAITWRSATVLVTVANEPNRPDEWGGAPDPAAYARFLRDVGDGLRRVSGVRVLVLNGALDSYAPSLDGERTYSIDAERFMEGMVAEVPDIFDRLDGWASHAYPLGPFGEHPERQVFKIDDVRPDAPDRPLPPSDLPNRGVNGYAWELWKLASLGMTRELPVYVTETGWRHRSSQASPSLDVDYAVVEDARFARYMALAYDGPPNAPAQGWVPWNQDGRVRTAALFALAGRPDHWGHTNLALVGRRGAILAPYPFAEGLATVPPGLLGPPPPSATAPTADPPSSDAPTPDLPAADAAPTNEQQRPE